MPDKLWIEQPRSSLPMAAVAYATCIMVDMRRAGMVVPLHTVQGYSTQNAIEAIVKDAMKAAVEHERHWRRGKWRRMIADFFVPHGFEPY